MNLLGAGFLWSGVHPEIAEGTAKALNVLLRGLPLGPQVFPMRPAPSLPHCQAYE